MDTRRREFLAGGGAGLVASLAPLRLVAEIRLGAATVTTVSDGHLVLPGDFIFGPMPQDELREVLARHGQPREQLEPPCNVTLYKDGPNVVLFDAGAGPDFMPSAGELVGNLEAAGVVPEEVTHVVFTHAHPDHIWGVLDDFGDPLFSGATHMMGREEWDYWWDPDTVTRIGEARAAFAAGARRRMEMLEDSMALFDAGQEILPGVLARATFGHTPGHTAFELRSGSEAVMIVGDAIGNDHVAFARPEWPSGSDQDPETAAATRAALLDQLASEQLRMIGFHLPGDGIGRVERRGDEFRFVPKP